MIFLLINIIFQLYQFFQKVTSRTFSINLFFNNYKITSTKSFRFHTNVTTGIYEFVGQTQKLTKVTNVTGRLRASKVAVGVQTDIVPTKLIKEVSLGAQTDLLLLKEIGVLTDGSYTKRRDGSDDCKRLRASKVAVGVQTDIVPTKLIKEVSLGAQTDLLLLKEIGVLTDRSYTKRRDGSDDYILTYSVPSMTDAIETECVSTQTLIPRYQSDSFFADCERNINSNDSQLIQKCTNIEKQLIHQLEKLRNSVIPLTACSTDHELWSHKLTSHARDNITSPGETDTHTIKDTIRSLDSKAIILKQSLDGIKYRPKLLHPTQLSWYFEYDPDLPVYSNKFAAYTITAKKPWDSFFPISYSNYDLNSLLESIDQLIDKSSSLVHLIEHIVQSKKTSESSTLNYVPEKSQFVPYVYKPPSDYWIPIIIDQEKTLADLKRLKGTDVSKL